VRRQAILAAATLVAALGGVAGIAGHGVIAALIVVPVVLVAATLADASSRESRRAAIHDLRTRAADMNPQDRQRAFDALVAKHRGEGTRALKELARELGVERRSSFRAQLLNDFKRPIRTRRR
jgi:HEAT repeat protein